jgi:hypothetical protein
MFLGFVSNLLHSRIQLRATEPISMNQNYPINAKPFESLFIACDDVLEKGERAELIHDDASRTRISLNSFCDAGEANCSSEINFFDMKLRKTAFHSV